MSPSPRPTRRARSSLLDARFLIGIALVACSVAGVWGVVHAARETAPVLVAARAIVPGQTITAADVVEIEAQLGDAAAGYIVPADLEAGLVSTRAVAEGELVPAAAVGDPDDADVTTVVVRSALDVPGDIVPGDTVELWAAPVVSPGEHGDPLVIVPDAIVGQVRADDGVVASAGAVLELVVARDAVAGVLAHVAGGSAISAVPVLIPDAAGGPAGTGEAREDGAAEEGIADDAAADGDGGDGGGADSAADEVDREDGDG
ncbi:SAF domain-containing protein [Microbacterium karelineae]|uniref:SAF domain-containing protein n=1 Tax=Microbacterium karelineae TaxID=2654283 RepID=UPI0018D3659B|nr:SAF domain-containing protein [Microbacterium karelineae]